jgi:hypothetical protein
MTHTLAPDQDQLADLFKWPFKMTPVQISAWDRRNAAIHEAGHIVMARRLGLSDTCGVIFHLDDDAPLLDKTWGGRTALVFMTRLTSVERQMVAVAGAVAELCWRRELVDLDYWEEPIACRTPTGCSPSARLDDPTQGADGQFWRSQTSWSLT